MYTKWYVIYETNTIVTWLTVCNRRKLSERAGSLTMTLLARFPPTKYINKYYYGNWIAYPALRSCWDDDCDSIFSIHSWYSFSNNRLSSSNCLRRSLRSLDCCSNWRFIVSLRRLSCNGVSCNRVKEIKL